MNPFGTTRSSIRRNHALITPDTHVESTPVGWQDAATIVHISPELGARFTQYTAVMQRGGASAMPGEGIQRAIFVTEGDVELETRGSQTLGAGNFAYLPPNVEHTIRATCVTRLVVFEKSYQPLEGVSLPEVVVGHERDVPSEPFQGDPDARLQTLLPVDPAFDMAINVFTYQPGATLPQVEVHVMEHGLVMLAGAGVYRLGDSWYPVEAGDVIWMASYCPQWFVAMGKTPAQYLYYKDIHRDRITDK